MREIAGEIDPGRRAEAIGAATRMLPETRRQADCYRIVSRAEVREEEIASLGPLR